MIVFKKLYPLDSKGLRPSKGKVHLMTFCMWIKCCTFLPQAKLQKAFVFFHILEQKNWVVGKIGEQLEKEEEKGCERF